MLGKQQQNKQSEIASMRQKIARMVRRLSLAAAPGAQHPRTTREVWCG